VAGAAGSVPSKCDKLSLDKCSFVGYIVSMKLILQQLGTVWLIGIESKDPKEMERQYYSFWNHGATNGGLHEMCDTFSYIVSDEERVKKYFLNSSLHLILNKWPDAYKGFEGGAMPHAKILAKRRLEELMENTEVFMSTNPVVYDYSLGRTEARENPSKSKAFDEEEWKQNSANQRSRLETA
tara:strand:+ start:1408 stop:1953 length:546 start_codon:yes stop_codon:yes gene_type:complete